MSRPRALDTEILAGGNYPAAKECLPHPVDRHPRGERIVRRYEPAGETEPIGWSILRQRRQNGRDRCRHFFAGRQKIPALVNESLARFLPFFEHEGRQWRAELFPRPRKLLALRLERGRQGAE